jgi:Carboxypeptidase regulatory-like domain
VQLAVLKNSRRGEAGQWPEPHLEGSNMKKLQSVGLIFFSLTLVAFAWNAKAARAQDVTATITGTVTDPSGAPIAGATVTAHDTERGTAWTSLTNEAGLYNIIRIPVGTYDLKVEAKGFQRTAIAPFTLVLNQIARFDVQMKVGPVSETVEVTDAPPVLKTETTEVSTLIDSKTLTTLPLASRNYIQLALLAPGVTTNNPDALMTPHIMTDEGRPFINGNREQAIEFFLDGIINDEEKNNEVAYQPNADAIQEFNLISQNPGADFGNYAGGVISVEIKAGTNQYHGNVFEFFRNDYLNSKQKTTAWSNGFGPQNRLRYNQFGGTFGGPIKKDKLFFFADYQGFRFPTSGGSSARLLTAAERTGDFSDWCTQNSGTVSAAGCSNPKFNIFDPVHKAVAPWNCLAATCSGNVGAGDTPTPLITGLTTTFLKNYPVPTTNNALGDNINFVAGNLFSSDQGDLRMDFKMSDKDSIFGRYSKWHTSRVPTSGLPFSANNTNAAVPADQPGWSSVANWTHTFNPNLLNEARLGVNVFRFFQNVTLTSGLGPITNQMLGLTAPYPVTSINGQQGGLPFFSFSGGFADASLGDPMIMQNFLDTYIQYEDNVVITKGRHTLTTGFQYVRERLNWLYAGNNGALGTIVIGNSTGNQLADFWIGDISSGGGRDSGLGGGLYHFNRGGIFGTFVQDNWRATSTVTLNLGVRFEDHTPFHDTQNHVVNFGLFTGQIETPGSSGYSSSLYNNYLGIGDWQPRVGFAWSPGRLHGKTVVRGAYGISSYREGGGANEELQMNLPYGTITQGSPATTGVQALNSSFAWPGLPANCVQPNFSCYAGSRIRVYPPTFRPALIQQWNLTIQHRLTNTLTAQLGYVGQKGTRLINFQDLAQLEGLNAQGKIAKTGELITSYAPGPYLGGQVAGATPANNLYYADNPALGGREALAGANSDNGHSRYDSLQAVLNERGWHGLTGQVAYTYSKCLTDSPGYFGVAGGGWTTSATTESSSGIYGTQNIYDQGADWGGCYYDQTHILSSYAYYELPVGRGKQFGSDLNPVLNSLVGNWQISGIISAHSGNALTLNYFGGWGAPPGPGPSSYGDTSGTNGIGPYTLSERPSCNGPIKILNQFHPAVAGVSGAYIQWFDTSNISPPTLGTFGTCGVGNIRGPRDQNWDLSLQKDFAVTESKKFQLRLDMLNAFNYAHWTFAGSVWNGSFSAGAFPGGGSANSGRIVGSQGARQLQLGLKFQF